MIFQNDKFYHEQIMAVSLFIHTSVSHFFDLISTFIIFRTLFCCTKRMRTFSCRTFSLENLGFVYNRPNQSQRLHLQNVLQVFTSTL